MIPIRPRPRTAVLIDYLERWPSLRDEQAKLNYLGMLKERAQLQNDHDAHKALLTLVQSWLQEPYQPS